MGIALQRYTLNFTQKGLIRGAIHKQAFSQYTGQCSQGSRHMDKGVLYEQRKELRIPYRGAVRFSADQFHWYLNTSQNISKEGLFIETEEVFAPDALLYLYIDLRVNDRVVKKIRTTGRVVRLAGGGEGTFPKKSAGIGIRFSLLPGDERIIRDFAEQAVNHVLSQLIPPSRQTDKQVMVAVHSKSDSYLRWWLKEALNRMLGTKGLILEMALILAFMVLFVVIFL